MDYLEALLMKAGIHLGLTEKIVVIGNSKKKKSLIARVDSGAVISSIDQNLAKELMLGPITRTKTVKSANGKTKRPVMKCSFLIHGKTLQADVTIADRSLLKYRVLLGQNLLRKTNMLIDPKKKA